MRNITRGYRELLLISLLYALGIIIPMQDINMFIRVNSIVGESMLTNGISMLSFAESGNNKNFEVINEYLRNRDDISFSFTEDKYMKYSNQLGKSNITTVSKNWDVNYAFYMDKSNSDTYYISPLFRSGLFSISEDGVLVVGNRIYNNLSFIPSFEYWGSIIIPMSDNYAPSSESIWTKVRVYGSNDSLKEVESKISSLFNSSVSFKNGSEILRDNQELVLKSSLNMLKFSLILLFFSLLNIIFLLQMRWENNEEVYNTKMILGASKESLTLELFFEYFLISSFSILLARFALPFVSKKFLFMKYLGTDYRVTLIFILIHLVLSLLISMYRIRKLFRIKEVQHVFN